MKLKNKNIVVTRQPEQAQTFIRLIEQEGGKSLLFPTIATTACQETQSEQKEVLTSLAQYDWLVFSSANAVHFFFKQLTNWGLQLPPLKIAVVGSRTAQVLNEYHKQPDLVPDDFSAKGLMAAFSTLELRGTRILIPTSNLAREELQTTLKLHGAQVKAVVFYKTVANPNFNIKQFRTLLLGKKIDVITFFSPSAFNFLVELLNEDGLNLLQLSGTHLAAIGQTTAKAIYDRGLTVHMIPRVSTSKGMIEAIIEYYQGK